MKSTPVWEVGFFLCQKMNCTTWKSGTDRQVRWKLIDVCGDITLSDSLVASVTPSPIVTPVDPGTVPTNAVLSESLDYIMAEDLVTYITAEG